MNMRAIGNLFTKNSPTILTGGAVMGLFGTVVLAVGATPKAIQLIEGEQCEQKELLTVPEIIQVSWKYYVPAAIMGLLTIGCIVGANKINLRRNAALAAAYGLLEVGMKEYQAKVIETFGKPKHIQVKDDIARDRILNNPVSSSEVIMTGKGETLCYEALSGRYFKSDIERITQALSKISYQMMDDSSVTLNEVYNALDLSDTKMGDLIGWHIDDGTLKPEFSSQLADDGIPCLVLNYVTEPRYLYRD